MKCRLIPLIGLFVFSLPSSADAGVMYGNPVADRMACDPGCLGAMVRCLGRCEVAKDRLLFGWMHCGHCYRNCDCRPACGCPQTPFNSPGAMYYGSPYPVTVRPMPRYAVPNYYGGSMYRTYRPAPTGYGPCGP